MQVNDLTSSSLIANKTRPGSGATTSTANVPSESQSNTGNPVERLATSALAAGQPSLSEPAETAIGAKTESQNLIQDTLNKLNDLKQTSIAFSQHEETGRTVITVSDKETGEEIRTIPSEDFLAIAAHLEEVLDSAEGLAPGLLVSSRA